MDECMTLVATEITTGRWKTF